ncbi:protein NATD1 [Carlito syrichta]|uniref:Protein NATD1 n=1 Tax=Carlito syrichta TaxID=1868482 RepID=A0A3Q0E7L3_CARSF|nr:protein NATD1 [Carlito syrichta]
MKNEDTAEAWRSRQALGAVAGCAGSKAVRRCHALPLVGGRGQLGRRVGVQRSPKNRTSPARKPRPPDALRPRCHDQAVLLYEYVGKRIVDLQHTEVPDAYRGRGIAKHLAKAALDFVVEEDLKAHLTCWYIQKYVKENPLPQYLERLQP